MRFSNSSKKEHGIHYTPALLANFVASQIATVRLKRNPTILDPACGDGELLLALSSKLDGRGKITGIDMDPQALQVAHARLRDTLPKADIETRQEDFLLLASKHISPTLFNKESKFDIVIANPPYVRTQVLGAHRSQEIAREFSLSGRVDLYFAFILGIAAVLEPEGVAGIIVSNRFMTTRAGTRVREIIRREFELLHVWDLGDTKMFRAAVLPAVLLLRKRRSEATWAPKFSSIYASDLPPAHEASNPIEALTLEGVVQTQTGRFQVRHGVLDDGPNGDEIWRIGTETGDAWLNKVATRTHSTFGDIGKIRVGVKTTADKIFIKKKWPGDKKPELLRPLVNHYSARRFKPFESTWEILYTHEMQNGCRKVVDLDKYPNAKNYLEQNRPALESRKYVIEAGRKWYEIWVPQNPSQWPVPKLVFPDISEKPVFWISLNGDVINGDCYWLAPDSPSDLDRLWLALAVANSRFIETYYDHAFNNKLYSGRRRFMTQYVQKFPIPDPTADTSREIIKCAKEIYELTPSIEAERLSTRLEYLILEVFGVAEE